MGCEVSIQVHPMPPEPAEVETAKAEPIKEYKKLTREDSMASTVTIMLDEADFQGV